MIGPTQGGKTTLAKAILPKREYVAFMATKPKDPALDVLKKRGWHKIDSWPPPRRAKHVLLWPPYKRPEYESRQRAVLREAFEDIFEHGGWTIYVDEVMYVADDLALDDWLKRVWRQGSAMGITLVASTQRPAFVPLDMYSAASWLFFFSTNEARDLDRLAGLGRADSKIVRREVQTLDRHEVLVVGTRDGTLVRTKVELER